MVGLGGGADARAHVVGLVESDRSMTLIISSLTVMVSLGPFVAPVVVGVEEGETVDAGGLIPVSDDVGTIAIFDICVWLNGLRLTSSGVANCWLGC